MIEKAEDQPVQKQSYANQGNYIEKKEDIAEANMETPGG